MELPNKLIEQLSEDLLVTFSKAQLIDVYDIYQHLMDYWADTMQDDCYLVSADGWKEAAQPRPIVEDKKNKTKTRPDLTAGNKKYLTELLQPSLLISRYYKIEQETIEKLEAGLLMRKPVSTSNLNPHRTISIKKF